MERVSKMLDHVKRHALGFLEEKIKCMNWKRNLRPTRSIGHACHNH